MCQVGVIACVPKRPVPMRGKMIERYLGGSGEFVFVYGSWQLTSTLDQLQTIFKCNFLEHYEIPDIINWHWADQFSENGTSADLLLRKTSILIKWPFHRSLFIITRRPSCMIKRDTILAIMQKSSEQSGFFL